MRQGRTPLHTDPYISNYKSEGGPQLRAKKLIAECESLGVRLEKYRRTWLFFSEDAPEGVPCKTLDEVEEEMDNWR